jgi:hypothetical protein
MGADSASQTPRKNHGRSRSRVLAAVPAIAAFAFAAGCSSNGRTSVSAAETSDASVDSGFDGGSNATAEAQIPTGPFVGSAVATSDASVEAEAVATTPFGTTGGDDEGVPATTDAGSPSEANQAALPNETGDAGPVDSGTDAGLGNGGDVDSSAAAAQDSEPSSGVSSLPVDCSPDAGGAIGPSGAPALLACTGLYSDWPSRTIASTAVAYDPGLHLWSDGATKSRYIALPPGNQIDTSNMDEWTFPVGTKVWKEFVVAGKKVETRYLLKDANGSWTYTTYQWSPDQTAATELTTGATNVNGTGYEIPPLEECRLCHMGRLDFVLGFEAIALSSPLATGLTMNALVAQQAITSPPAAPLTIPGDATASAALGWLHANCGTACHNSSHYALAGMTGFFMRLEAAKLSSVQTTDTYVTGVNATATFKEPDGGSLLRIAPGDPADSCVVFRDGYRDVAGEKIQMPPIDTHVVDSTDLAVVKSWISSL